MNVLAEFLPAEILADGRVRLVQTGPPPFTEAFCAETVEQALAGGAASATVPAGRLVPGAVAGVVVHLGRCGSTLLARLLDAAGAATFREPDALRPVEQGDGAAVAGHLGAMAEAVGRPAVIKLPSTAHDLVAAGGPLARYPRVALVRPPVETIARVLHGPPWWAVARFVEAGAATVGEDGLVIDDGAVAVEVLCEAWGDAARSIAESGPEVLVVAFDRLVAQPEAVVAAVAAHQGWVPVIDRDRIRAVMAVDAKAGWSLPSTGPSTPPPLPPGAERLIADRCGSVWSAIEARIGVPGG